MDEIRRRARASIFSQDFDRESRPGKPRRPYNRFTNLFFRSEVENIPPSRFVSFANTDSRENIQLLPAAQGINVLQRNWRKPLIALTAMVSLLLLIACANLASLFLTRNQRRKRDIAVRLALGATEGLIIAAGGGILGLSLTAAITSRLVHLLPTDLTSGWLSGYINPAVLLFSVFASLSMSIVFGLLPIFRTARPDLIPALTDRTSSISANRKEVRFRKVLVAVQIGFSLVLVVGSGLFSRSLSNLLHQNFGFQTENLTTFSVTPELSGYSAARGLALAEQIQARLKELPDIQAVSFAGLEPLSGSESLSNITWRVTKAVLLRNWNSALTISSGPSTSKP
jgi:hypothetical protein